MVVDTPSDHDLETTFIFEHVYSHSIPNNYFETGVTYWTAFAFTQQSLNGSVSSSSFYLLLGCPNQCFKSIINFICWALSIERLPRCAYGITQHLDEFPDGIVTFIPSSCFPRVRMLNFSLASPTSDRQWRVTWVHSFNRRKPGDTSKRDTFRQNLQFSPEKKKYIKIKFSLFSSFTWQSWIIIIIQSITYE